MKVILLLFTIIFTAKGQKKGIELNTQTPEAGQRITIKYSGNLAIAGSKMFIVIYKTSRIDTDVKRIHTSLVNNNLVGEVILPDSTAFFVIKVENKNLIDNNDGKGYCFNIYKDSRPLKGTYFTQAYATILNKSLYKGDIDFDKMMQLFEKEYQLFPDLKDKTFPYYLQSLSKVPGKGPEAIQLAKQKYSNIIEKKENEQFSVLYSYIIGANNFKVIDSLVSKVARIYPTGSAVFNRKFTILQNNSLNNPELAIINYDEIVDAYPRLSIIQRRLLFVEMLWIYAKKNDFEKVDKTIFEFLKAESSKEAQSYLAFNLNNIAWKFSQTDSTLNQAKIFAEKAIEARINSDTLSIYYGNVLDIYASILYKLGQKEKALSYQRKVIELMNNNDSKINQHFIEYLVANNQMKEAKVSAEEFIKENVANSKIDSLYKFILEQIDFENKEDDFARVKDNSNKNYEFTIRQSLINVTAPNFKLKDLNGIEVQLSDFKGKIVILDFWATWCAPCIKAFPAMQIAMDELKDQNVKFLFIDTFEEDISKVADKKNLHEKIQKIIKSRDLKDFHILIDPLKDNINQTASEYNITSIPAKIVIDKNGIMRYNNTGFKSNESLIKELKTVVSLIN